MGKDGAWRSGGIQVAGVDSLGNEHILNTDLFGTLENNAVISGEADTFARLTQGYIKDTEELRLQAPTTYINGLSYIGVAPAGSATSASVWDIIKITYDANGHKSRVQYMANLTWDTKF